MQVKFTNVDEFLAEIAAEVARVEDRVVRVTCSWHRSQPLTALWVVATALVAGRIVRLEKLCGDYMFAESNEARAVGKRADDVADHVRAEAAKLGLEVRSGVYEPAEGK